MDEINLALCTDDNFIRPTLVAVDSVLKSNEQFFFNVFIVTSGLTEHSKAIINKFAQKATDSAKIKLLVADKSFLNSCPIKDGDHVSYATYLRILLPSILPESINKILYIDGDILCVTGIKNFYDLNLDGKSSAAVPDERNNSKEIFSRLNYPESLGYFNAGVMLINLDYWRKNNIQAKALKYISENPEKCIWHDQDALNKILAGTVLFGSFKYNLTQGFLFDKEQLEIDASFWPEIDSAIKNPCLIHYCAAYKPWHIECNSPYKKLWRDRYRKVFGKRCRLRFKNKGVNKIKWLFKLVLNSLHIKHYADFRKSILEKGK